MVFVDPDDLTLVTDPHDPCFDPRVALPLREQDLSNVAKHGIIEPVVARRRGDQIIILDGRQRVRWGREINRRLREQGSELMRVPVVFRAPEDDREAIEVAVSANSVRSDDGPFDKARQAAKLLKLGRTIDEIAVSFGATRQGVDLWLRALELTEPVRRAVVEERITITDAIKTVGRLPPEKQGGALAELEQAKARVKNGKPVRRPGEPRLASRGSATNSTSWRARHLVRFVAANASALPAGFDVVLLWILREATDGELLAAHPSLRPLVEIGPPRADRPGKRKRRDWNAASASC
jgi:hypothetical protein